VPALAFSSHLPAAAPQELHSPAPGIPVETQLSTNKHVFAFNQTVTWLEMERLWPTLLDCQTGIGKGWDHRITKVGKDL